MKQSTAIFFIHDFEKRMRDELRISVQTKYFSKGGACSHVDLDKPHKVNIAVADSILNKNLVNDPYGVKEYDFVEALINIAHEAHHSAVLQGKRDIDDGEDIRALSESYASRIYNDRTYEAEYGKFSYEIAAERYALKMVRGYMRRTFSGFNIDGCLMDYVRAKTINNADEDNHEFPFPYAIPMGRRYHGIDEVLVEFDAAYNASFIDKKDFKREGDLLNAVMKENSRFVKYYDGILTGREQAAFMVGILREYDLKSFKKFSALRGEDYDIEKILDENYETIGVDGKRSFGIDAARALDDLRRARDALGGDDDIENEDGGHDSLGE